MSNQVQQIPIEPTLRCASIKDRLINIAIEVEAEVTLKNKAFHFLAEKGLYPEFHNWLHSGGKEGIDEVQQQDNN